MSGGSDTAPGPSDSLETRVVRRKLSELTLLEGHENARYMKAAQFNRLVDNTALAVGMMAQLALERLEELVPDEEGEAKEPAAA